MEDVLDVYARAHDPDVPLVCLDEFCQQLIAEVRDPEPCLPGMAAKQDYEYERRGVCSGFMLYSPLEHTRAVQLTGTRTAKDYAATIKWLCDELYPAARKIVLVQDNLNTHTPASLYEAFTPEEASRLKARIEWHYTPKHGSWLNMAEIEIGVLLRQCLNRRISSKTEMAAQSEAWATQRNRHQCGTDWRFSTQDARIKLKRLYPAALMV
jgi:hypothetical protein